MRVMFLIAVLGLVAVVAVAGWRGVASRRPPIEIFPDMVRQPKLRPQTLNAFFADRFSSRLPVPGTIPHPWFPVGRSQASNAWPANVSLGSTSASGGGLQDGPLNTGRVAGTTNFLTTNPLPITGPLLARGQRQFNIVCAACHTQLGDGQSVARRLAVMPVIANLHELRIIEQPDGELFGTVSHGKNLMAGYAADLDARDRWAIVAYLRALQRSRLGTLQDVPEPLRHRLNP